MRRLIPAAVLMVGAVAIIAVPGGAAQTEIKPDRTPLSCDGKKVGHHVHRALAIIDDGYERSRYPDRTPMRRAEKNALRKHKLCVLDEGRQKRIERYRDRAAAEYRAYWKRRRAGDVWDRRWAALSAADQAWARSTSACESDYPSQHDPSGTYHGGFQFMLSTWASSPLSPGGDPHTYPWKVQAVVAVALKNRDGAGHWPVCG